MNEKEKVEKAVEGSKDETVAEPKEIPPAEEKSKDSEVEDTTRKDTSERFKQKVEEKPPETEKKEPTPKKDDTSKDAPDDGKKEVKEQEAEKKTGEIEQEEPKEPAKKDELPIPDPLEGFELLSRKEAVGLLVKKHSGLIKKYEDEIKGLDVKPPEIVQEKEEEKGIRDSINEKVQTLKGKRKELKDKNKQLREEFFDLLDKEEKLKGHSKEVSMYSKFSKDLEWKLETEAITIETERRLLDELRETLDKMRSITDGLTPQEIHSRLNEIQEEMGSNLMTIEDYHRQMLEKVGESNLHHGKFVDAKNQIRERESRRGWLKRRIELHVEMGKFWAGQLDQAVKLDSEDGARNLEMIKASLLKSFKERDGVKDEVEESKEKKEKGSSKKPSKEKKEPSPDNGTEKEKTVPVKEESADKEEEKTDDKVEGPKEKKEKGSSKKPSKEKKEPSPDNGTGKEKTVPVKEESAGKEEEKDKVEEPPALDAGKKGGGA